MRTFLATAALFFLLFDLAQGQETSPWEMDYVAIVSGDICGHKTNAEWSIVQRNIGRQNLYRYAKGVPKTRVIESEAPQANCDPKLRRQQGELDARWAEFEEAVQGKMRVAELTRGGNPKFPSFERLSMLCHSSGAYSCLEIMARLDPSRVKIDWVVITGPAISQHLNLVVDRVKGQVIERVRQDDVFSNANKMEIVRQHLVHESSRGLALVISTSDPTTPEQYDLLVDWAAKSGIHSKLVVFSPTGEADDLTKPHLRTVQNAIDKGVEVNLLPFSHTTYPVVEHRHLMDLGGNLLRFLREFKGEGTPTISAGFMDTR